MLKTNSNRARENVRAYIMDNFTPENYTDNPPKAFPEIAAFILDTFRREKYSCREDYSYYHNSEKEAFIDWCAGLTNLLDTCYYYNRSAVDDLAAILEENEAEKARYIQSGNEYRAEEKAADLLTSLIYKELTAAAQH